MSIYDIDFNEGARQQTPVRLRKTKRLAWLRAIVAGIKYLYNEFMKYRGSATTPADNASVLYNLAHNSQVCYMEAALNDVFDRVSRGIYITDGAFEGPLYIYIVPELKPVYLATEAELPVTEYDAPVYVWTEVEIATDGYMFIVHIPIAVTYDEDRLKAIVDKYRLPGRWKYGIVTF